MSLTFLLTVRITFNFDVEKSLLKISLCFSMAIVTCTKGKNQVLYFFIDGKRVAEAKIPYKPKCNLSKAALAAYRRRSGAPKRVRSPKRVTKARKRVRIAEHKRVKFAKGLKSGAGKRLRSPVSVVRIKIPKKSQGIKIRTAYKGKRPKSPPAPRKFSPYKGTKRRRISKSGYIAPPPSRKGSPKTPPPSRAGSPLKERIPMEIDIEEISSKMKSPTKGAEIYHIWTQKEFEYRGRKVILPDHEVATLPGAAFSKKNIEDLYKRFNPDMSLVFVSDDTSAALHEVEENRTSWDEERWDTFINLLYPYIKPNIQILDPKTNYQFIRQKKLKV
jgi:hypothetical protein